MYPELLHDIVDVADPEVLLILRGVTQSLHHRIGIPSFPFHLQGSETYNSMIKLGDRELCLWLSDNAYYPTVYDMKLRVTYSIITNGHVHLFSDFGITPEYVRRSLQFYSIEVIQWALDGGCQLTDEEKTNIYMDAMWMIDKKKENRLRQLFPDIREILLKRANHYSCKNPLGQIDIFPDLQWQMSCIPASCWVVKSIAREGYSLTQLSQFHKCRKRDIRRLIRHVLRQTCRWKELKHTPIKDIHLKFKDYNYFSTPCSCLH